MNSKILKRFSIVAMCMMLLVNGGMLVEAYAYEEPKPASDHLCEDNSSYGGAGGSTTCYYSWIYDSDREAEMIWCLDNKSSCATVQNAKPQSGTSTGTCK